MIYVLKAVYLDNKEVKTFIKIGYTEDSKKLQRYSQYQLHNPCFEIIHEIPGCSPFDEHCLQQKFNTLRKYPGSEWFLDNEGIIENFVLKYKSRLSLLSDPFILNPTEKMSVTIPKMREYFRERSSYALNYLKRGGLFSKEFVNKYIIKVYHKGLLSTDYSDLLEEENKFLWLVRDFGIDSDIVFTNFSEDILNGRVFLDSEGNYCLEMI